MNDRAGEGWGRVGLKFFSIPRSFLGIKTPPLGFVVPPLANPGPAVADSGAEGAMVPLHPEGTSIGSDNCDFLKVSDFNGSL